MTAFIIFTVVATLRKVLEDVVTQLGEQRAVDVLHLAAQSLYKCSL